MEIDISKHSHFSFDLWLTLIKSNPDFKIKRDVLLKDFFSLDKSFEDVQNKVRYFDLLLNRISEKTGLHVEREIAFLIILDALGKSEDSIASEDLKLFFHQVDQLFLENLPVLLWENIENILSKIQDAGKTSSILSNTAFIHGDSLIKVLDKMGLSSYFSFMIFSDVIKVSKPNPKIFDMVYNEVNLIKLIKKENVLHIGDNSIADFNGAKSFGFDAQLVKF